MLLLVITCCNLKKKCCYYNIIDIFKLNLTKDISINIDCEPCFDSPGYRKWMFLTLYTAFPDITTGSTDSHVSANSTGSLQTEKGKCLSLRFTIQS